MKKKKSKLSRKRKRKPQNQDVKPDDLLVTHVMYTNKEVCSHNIKMLNILTTTLVEIPAKIPPGFKPATTEHGTIGKSQFQKNLKIKIGARVMMIFNIDTIDGMVNGELGHIIGIEQREGHVEYIIVEFDDKECGSRQRQKYPGLSAKYATKNGTPIARQEFDYQFVSNKGYKHALKKKMKQFPLTLAWAMTCHKTQGQTIKKNSKLIVHWHTKLKDGMAYVM